MFQEKNINEYEKQAKEYAENKRKEIVKRLQIFDRFFKYNEVENKLDCVFYNTGGKYWDAIVDKSESAERIWYAVLGKVQNVLHGEKNKNEIYTDILKLIAHASKHVEDDIELFKKNGEIILHVRGDSHTYKINYAKEGKDWIKRGIAKGEGYEH